MQPPVFMKRYVVYRRLAELFLPSILFSVLITLLNVLGIVVKRTNVIIMILVFMAFFTIYNFRNLRRCYFDIRNKKLFFALNFLSHGIFATVNLVFFAFASNEVYAWLFSITKALTFIDINIIHSIMFFHFIGLFCIVASTTGMQRIFDEMEEELT